MTEKERLKTRSIAYAAKILALGMLLISLGANLLSYSRQVGHYGVSVLGAILGIIGAAIMLGIGVVVIAMRSTQKLSREYVQTSLPTSGLNTQANSTITTVFNQTYTSLLRLARKMTSEARTSTSDLHSLSCRCNFSGTLFVWCPKSLASPMLVAK